MPTRKSIRDIQTSGMISDMVSINTSDNVNKAEITKKTRIKKTDSFIDNNSPIYPTSNEDASMINEMHTDVFIKKDTNKGMYRKLANGLSKIKTIHLIILGIVLLIITISVLASSYYSKDPTKQIQKEVESVKKQFAKHIVLPTNEQIDIRKITNKIEDPFFKDAQVGDYLIIFYKNRIAYIYSIDRDIIINAGVVFIDPKTATTSSTTKQ